MIFNFDALQHIAKEERFLTEVEEYLRTVDRGDLAYKLNKLQQDAGAQMFSDILGKNAHDVTLPNNNLKSLKDFIDSEPLETTDPIIDAFEELTEERGHIFSEVGDVMSQRGGMLNEKYQNFFHTLHDLTTPKGPLPVVSGPFLKN